MKRIATMAISLFLVGAAPAMAASSTCPSYHSDCNSIQHFGTTSPVTTRSTATGTLPFTGLDMGLLVAGGGSLLGLGFILRRTSNHTG